MTVLIIETLIWLLAYTIVLFYGSKILQRYWGYVAEAKSIGNGGRLLVAKSRRRMFGILVFKAFIYVLIGILAILRLTVSEVREFELYNIALARHTIVVFLVIGAILQALVFYLLDKDDRVISQYRRL